MKKPKAQICGFLGLILLLLLCSLNLPGVKSVLTTSVTISASGSIVSQTSGPLSLHTSGLNIYDSNGKQVKLYTCAIHYGGGQHITATDIANIASYGFNAVRLHIYWNEIQPSSGSSVDSTYFTSTGDVEPAGIGLDSIVQWCTNNNMYIILNPYWGASYPAPSWVPIASSGGVQAGTDPNSYDIFGTTVTNGVAYMYSWMANHYANNKNVIFESFNEMQLVKSSDAGTPFANFNNAWISAIETNEGTNTHLKIIESVYGLDYTDYFTPPYVTGPQPRSNVLLASHDYPPYSSWNPTGSQGITWVQNRLAADAATYHSAGYPCIDTEFSKSQNQANFTSWFTASLSSFASSNYCGWTYWCYSSNVNSESSGGSTWNIKVASIRNAILPTLQQYMVQP